MTNYAMKAVVLGPRSGGDRWYDYEFDRDPEQTPADELVEHLGTPGRLGRSSRKSRGRPASSRAYGACPNRAK